MPYRDETKQIQKALLSLGYSLPKWGADGKAGDETFGAADAWIANDGEPVAAPVSATDADFNARSVKNLQDVHPDLVRVMTLARSRTPVPFTVIEGLRSVERQRQLVAQGASTTINSRHITGHAADIVPHRPNGKIAFDWPLYYIVAPIIKEAARELGVAVEWGGDWRSIKDGPHFQLSRKSYP